MRTIFFPLGTTPEQAAAMLANAATADPEGQAVGHFYAAPMSIGPGMREGDVLNAYTERYREHLTSLANHHPAEHPNPDVRALQERHDKLMKDLETLHDHEQPFSYSAALDWIYDMFPSLSMVGVVKQPAVILAWFAKHNLRPYALPEDVRAPDKDDRNESAKNIIRQALGMINAGSLHQVVRHWIVNWKERFILAKDRATEPVRM